MNKTASQACLVEQGIQFKVIAGIVERDCIISKNALAYLGRLQGSATDYMAIYTGFEEKIHGIARRLVVAGESASPLILGTAYFVDVLTQSMSYAAQSCSVQASSS